MTRPRGQNTPLWRRARTISGLILFVYVATHLLNHAVGILSIELLQESGTWFKRVWHSPPATAALYGGFAIHLIVALFAIYRRDSLRDMRRAEIAQLALGLTIPVFLINHTVGTRVLDEFFGADPSYLYVQLTVWKFVPHYALNQTVLLLAAWIHGCIGLHLWLRYKPEYRRLLPLWLVLAVIVPTLSLAGHVASGMEVIRLAEDRAWLANTVASFELPRGADLKQALFVVDAAEYGYYGLVVMAFAARSVRLFLLKRSEPDVTLTYHTGQKVGHRAGASILETSQLAGIPHASVCGGRGRCSTCRVRIGAGLRSLPPPSELEARVLHRVGAPDNVRLACQTYPETDIEVTPLLPPTQASVEDTGARPDYLAGQERDIVVLFADIRGFTKLTEQRLPYDTVFILNRYFSEMGHAIEAAGGRIDKFIGDGIMALFGIDRGIETGARNAIAAARGMGENLKRLNESLAPDLSEPLRIGIGIHGGPAIVGELGYRATRGLTAVGDTVNTASRLEALTKEHGVQLILSEAVIAAAGMEMENGESVEISARGREERVHVRLIENAAELPDPHRAD
ncbi:adenylate/guanylate cyclase domain-containing protein [Nisaea acidiphila]|uniref:Adenylate/guanylate cyclase domain-containing protein n=1 Tax=Nisaea acidiphila TaxID=1862145 RepID=A0A9J7ALV1_9PROT|nr:adenylate/guanylate cyclase domain-containing protein [Nisaea acidiphila]UUX48134.1 adenylate/guanylate cyclase domain-containing protein [Nisaea acidiphila]